MDNRYTVILLTYSYRGKVLTGKMEARYYTRVLISVVSASKLTVTKATRQLKQANVFSPPSSL